MTNTTKNRNTFYDELIKGQTMPFIPKKTKTKQAEWVTLHPLQSRHILKFYNSNNRKPSKVQVTKYASDMACGDWKETGQPISFDQAGNMLDGQQRLCAMVMTDTSFETLVVYGLKREVFDVIDNGLIRTNATILGMEGYKDPAGLSALVRAVIAYESNGEYDAKNFTGVNQITISQIKNYLEDNPTLVTYMDRYKKSSVVSAPVAAFCYWLLSQTNKIKAEMMLDKVLLGYGLIPGTLEHYLFDKLQRNKNANITKMSKTAVICNIILCWRRFMGWSMSKSMTLQWDTRKGMPKPIA